MPCQVCSACEGAAIYCIQNDNQVSTEKGKVSGQKYGNSRCLVLSRAVSLSLYIYIYVCVCVYVRVCACVLYFGWA